MHSTENDTVYKSVLEQIDILKSRNVNFSDETTAYSIIDRENYYNVVNGYKNLFIEQDSKTVDEKYKDGVCFEEIYSLFLFDRNIRSLFLKYILIIENNLKAKISREFSSNYGEYNYLDYSNFDIVGRTLQEVDQKVKKANALIDKIKEEQSKQITSRNDMILHYYNKNNAIPLWVMVNKLSLGTIEIFYTAMNPRNRNNVAKHYCLKEDVLVSFFNTIRFFRNICAHDERFYSSKCFKPIKTLEIHKSLPKNRGIKDILSLIIVFSELLTFIEFQEFKHELLKYISELDANLKTITIYDVYNSMGLYTGWENINKVSTLK